MQDLNQRRFRHFLLVWFVAVWIFSPPLNAQLTRGTVSGTVSDGTNAVIVAAQVTVRNLGTGIERTTTTNEVGIYRLSTSQQIVLNETLSVGTVFGRSGR